MDNFLEKLQIKVYNNYMNKIIEFLVGKKTFIVVIAGLVVLGLKLLGFLDSTTADTILIFLGFSGLTTLRLAISGK